MKTNLLIICVLALLLGGCQVRYSFTGGSISPDARTYSVVYFPNNAAMVTPALSSTLTDALIDRFDRQSRLMQLREGGDLNVEGEIVGYTSTPSAITGDALETGGAAMNRLTISVAVRFTNLVEPQFNFNRTFTQSLEYPTSQLLQQAEMTLIPEIVEMLVDDIYNAATSNW